MWSSFMKKMGEPPWLISGPLLTKRKQSFLRTKLRLKKKIQTMGKDIALFLIPRQNSLAMTRLFSLPCSSSYSQWVYTATSKHNSCGIQRSALSSNKSLLFTRTKRYLPRLPSSHKTKPTTFKNRQKCNNSKALATKSTVSPNHSSTFT